MLVLSRKVNEEIVIGEGPSAIVLMVVEIRGDKVKLGVRAPEEVRVHRREVYEAIHRGQCPAAPALPRPTAALTADPGYRQD